MTSFIVTKFYTKKKFGPKKYILFVVSFILYLTLSFFFHSRVYSKFHKKCIVELDLNGITKFYQLAVTIAINLESADAINRLVALLTHVKFHQKTINFKKEYTIQLFILLVFAKQQKFDTNSIVNQILLLLNGLVSILAHGKASRDIHQQNINVLLFTFQLICQYLEEHDRDDSNENYLKFVSGDVYKILLTNLRGDEKILIYDHISHLLGIFCNHNFDCWSESNFSTVYESLREGLEHSWNQQLAVKNLMNIFALLTMLAMKW